MRRRSNGCWTGGIRTSENPPTSAGSVGPGTTSQPAPKRVEHGVPYDEHQQDRQDRRHHEVQHRRPPLQTTSQTTSHRLSFFLEFKTRRSNSLDTHWSVL